MALIVALVPLAASAQTTCASAPKDFFGVNLLVNGEAEIGPAAANASTQAAPVGWCSNGTFTAVAWGGSGGLPAMPDPGPQTRGANLFAGGPSAPVSVATQTLDMSGAAPAFDTGAVKYSLTGFLGGYSTQDDNAALAVTFKGADGASLGTGQIGPIKAADRQAKTGMVAATSTGTVPAGTRSADVAVTMTRVSGAYNDGYADNLGLVLTGTMPVAAVATPQPVAEPAPAPAPVVAAPSTATTACASQPGATFGPNLLTNGDAEAGPAAADVASVVAPVGWCSSGPFTAVAWGGDGGLPTVDQPGPEVRGANLFAGGPRSEMSSASQMVDLSAGTDTIDAGGVTFDLSAFLGGFSGQTDTSVITLNFKGADGAQLASANLGPMAAGERLDETGLWLAETIDLVPVGTRSAEVTVTMTRFNGSYNDGYADNLSLVLTAP